MRGISTLNLLRHSSVAALLAISCQTAFSQGTEPTPPTITRECAAIGIEQCTNIDITFEDPSGTGGNMFAFTSTDFELDGANSPNANSNFFLKSSPLSAGTKRLNSFYFTPNTRALSADYRFEISGTAQFTAYRVYLQSRTTLEFFPVCHATVQLPNQGPATICGTAPVPLALTGEFRFVFFFELTGQDNHYITFDNFGSSLLQDEAALPVNFIGLNAKKSTRGTELTWNVADEINVSRYEVQKGNNAGDLKTIGIVFAGERTSYTFTDENPSQGVTFYRIRSVDIDGKFKFSTVISFSNGRSAALLRAFPLPAQNQVTLQHGTIEGKAQISITSEDGRTIRRLVPAVGSMQTAIDLTGLKAGMYLLRLENSNGEVETLKLIKQ